MTHVLRRFEKVLQITVWLIELIEPDWNTGLRRTKNIFQIGIEFIRIKYQKYRRIDCKGTHDLKQFGKVSKIWIKIACINFYKDAWIETNYKSALNLFLIKSDSIPKNGRIRAVGNIALNFESD